jgi:hypothetical protein
VIDGRGLDHSRARSDKEEEQRQTVRPSGNCDAELCVSRDKLVERARETGDEIAL